MSLTIKIHSFILLIPEISSAVCFVVDIPNYKTL